MANDTPVYTDAASLQFAPHAKDKQATNAAGKPIYQSQFGADDGEIVTIGAKADAAPANPAAAGSVIAKLTGIWTALLGLPTSLGQKLMASSMSVTIAADQAAIPTSATATEAHLGEIGGNSAVGVATMTRPANTTAYVVGQLIANATVAASVTPMMIAAARKNGGTGRITRVRLTKSTPSLANANFRVHAYKAAPTLTNGDGGAWLTTESAYLGSFDITMDKAFVDGAKGIGASGSGAYVTFDTPPGSTSLAFLLEARGAYTPGSAEVFTVAVELDRD